MNQTSQFSIKYRPLSLDDVYGQDNIVRSLKSRIKERKFPTATLMQGPVGTGKTTCAKILAMAMQCQHPHEDGSPCLECASCKSILEETYGRDTVMLDASQFGQKDSAIELSRLINTRPLYDKNKVFIIEEIDQASQAFKLALLKIIEKNYDNRSPVYFILLSMESNGVPISIKSRCQTFNFKLIGIKDSMYAMKSVLEKDGRWGSLTPQFKTEGLATIASASKGSLRIALQNLEACLNGEIYTKDEILSFLNVVDETSTYKVLEGLLSLSKDETLWNSIYKSDPQELYNYLTLICSNVEIYKSTGYIDDDRFEDSTKRLSSSPHIDSLFYILTKHPQLCKPYMRKCDLLAALAEYYSTNKPSSIPTRSIRVRGV